MATTGAATSLRPRAVNSGPSKPPPGTPPNPSPCAAPAPPGRPSQKPAAPPPTGSASSSPARRGPSARAPTSTTSSGRTAAAARRLARQDPAASQARHPGLQAQIQRAAEAASYLEQWRERERGGQSTAWASWAARRAAQEEILRVTAANDPDIQAALRAPRAARAGADPRHVPAAAQEPVAAFARYAGQVLRAWREADADFLTSHRAELEAAYPGRFEAQSAGLWDRQVALSAVAATLTASDPDVRATAAERREAHEFNRRLHASIGAEYGGVPDDDPNIGSLAARHAADEVEAADQAYDEAYDEVFGRYYGQVEQTWDIDGSFPAVAPDAQMSTNAASWSPPAAPEAKSQPPEKTGATRANASSSASVEVVQVQPSAGMATSRMNSTPGRRRSALLKARCGSRRPGPVPALTVLSTGRVRAKRRGCEMHRFARVRNLREVPAGNQAIRPVRPSATGGDRAMTTVPGRLP